VLEAKAIQSEKNKKPIKKTTDSLELELQRQMTESTDPKNKEDSWGNRACNCVSDDNKTIYILTRLSKLIRSHSFQGIGISISLCWLRWPQKCFDIMQFSDRYEELRGCSMAPIAFVSCQTIV